MSFQPCQFHELTVKLYRVLATKGEGGWQRNEWPEVKMEQDCEGLGRAGMALHPDTTAYAAKNLNQLFCLLYWMLIWQGYMKGGENRKQRMPFVGVNIISSLFSLSCIALSFWHIWIWQSSFRLAFLKSASCMQRCMCLQSFWPGNSLVHPFTYLQIIVTSKY